MALLILVPVIPVISLAMAEGTYNIKLEKTQETIFKKIDMNSKQKLLSSIKNIGYQVNGNNILDQSIISKYSQMIRSALEKINHPTSFIIFPLKIIRLILGILFVCGGEILSLLLLTLNLIIANEISDLLSQFPRLLIVISSLLGVISVLPVIITTSIAMNFVGPISEIIIFVVYLLYIPLMLLWLDYIFSTEETSIQSGSLIGSLIPNLVYT